MKFEQFKEVVDRHVDAQVELFHALGQELDVNEDIEREAESAEFHYKEAMAWLASKL